MTGYEAMTIDVYIALFERGAKNGELRSFLQKNSQYFSDSLQILIGGMSGLDPDVVVENFKLTLYIKTVYDCAVILRRPAEPYPNETTRRVLL